MTAWGWKSRTFPRFSGSFSLSAPNKELIGLKKWAKRNSEAIAETARNQALSITASTAGSTRSRAFVLYFPCFRTLRSNTKAVPHSPWLEKTAGILPPSSKKWGKSCGSPLHILMEEK
jgi:hypothetical protein